MSTKLVILNIADFKKYLVISILLHMKLVDVKDGTLHCMTYIELKEWQIGGKYRVSHLLPNPAFL